MRLLLDTHILLWAVGMSGRLPIVARQTLENPEKRGLLQRRQSLGNRYQNRLKPTRFSDRPGTAACNTPRDEFCRIAGHRPPCRQGRASAAAAPRSL